VVVPLAHDEYFSKQPKKRMMMTTTMMMMKKMKSTAVRLLPILQQPKQTIISAEGRRTERRQTLDVVVGDAVAWLDFFFFY
jgi:hypothetical protein